MADVVVAMSGGVDSSVAAALLLDRGYAVTGVTLRLRTGADGNAPTQGCCTAEDALDARRVAGQLGIPYYVFDVSDDFAHDVIDPFVAGYRAGLTPNPCVECNRTVKFTALLARARSIGADFLATGHHVRTDGVMLFRARDSAKDQSYVLHMLSRQQIARCLFPVGELTKDDVRSVAHSMGLRTAGKPDSQDACFLGRGGVSALVRRRAGRVVDLEGRHLGDHDGRPVTIGQRRGTGVATGTRAYVNEIRSDGTVVVGPASGLARTRLELRDMSWVSGTAPDRAVSVQVRYRGPVAPARVDGVTVSLLAPLRAVAPGQSAVFYDGDEMLGGGIITAAS